MLRSTPRPEGDASEAAHLPLRLPEGEPAESRVERMLLAWSERIWRLRRGPRYAIGVAAALAAFAARLALVPLVGDSAPYLTVVPVVTAVALLLGTGPGLAAALAGLLAVEAWVVGPAGEIVLDRSGGIRAALVLAGAAFVGGLGARMRVAHASLRRSNAALRRADRARSDFVAQLQRANAALETERERARASETVLAQAGEIAHLGAWWIDFASPGDLTAPNHPVRWSDEVYRVFGYAPGEVEVTNGLFFQHVPAEDQQRIVDTVRRALADGRPYACEHRIARKDGTERVVVERAEVVASPEGGRQRLLGAVQDVTERKRAEAALRENEERFRAITEAMPQIVCVLRPDGSPEYLNARWKAFSGMDEAATAGAGWPGVLHPEDVPAAQACRRRALATGEPQEVELRYRGADGRYRWFLSRLAPVHGDGARVVRLVGAAMDIDARKQAEQTLRDTDRRKDEFLGMLSHELRNPLAPIRNAIYLLERADPTSDVARRAREVLARQSEHLTRLVDDLLDVTRIARGKIELRRAPVDLREVARRTADDLRSIVEEKELSLVVEVPAEPLAVHGDATRLGQVVGNLLSNAAKFTPAGGRITLALVRDGDGVEIRVRDTGVGIDPDLLGRVFEPFVQAERSLARTQGGLGLGLALVKGIAELHGGSVRAESAGPGEGAQFSVRLPAFAAAPGEEARSTAVGGPAGSPPA